MITVSALAQEKEKRFAYEVSDGPSMVTREFADGLRTGFGFDVSFHYRFIPHTGIYAGWGELAAGIDISLASAWSLTPVVKYHSLSRSLK